MATADFWTHGFYKLGFGLSGKDLAADCSTSIIVISISEVSTHSEKKRLKRERPSERILNSK
jgi:hypothetical protein